MTRELLTYSPNKFCSFTIQIGAILEAYLIERKSKKLIMTPEESFSVVRGYE
jgi:hypothetical protein